MLDQLIKFCLDNPYLTIIGATCIIQIAPIKIDPWTRLFKWIGKVITSDLQAKISEMEKQVKDLEEKLDTLKSDVSDERVQQKRWNILNFTNSCRQNHDRVSSHTKEEWDHCLDEVKWYEAFCTENHILNGVIEESARWLKERYKIHLDEDSFMKD